MRDCRKVIIAGAGLMGTSMAQIFAHKGYNVVIYDVMETALENSKNLIRINQEGQVQAGEKTQTEANILQDKLIHTCDRSCFEDCDIVIESIIEKMPIKQSFWSDISQIVPEDSILATNTSGLSITTMAEGVKNPERFAGMHWFNPAHIIPLIEIIKGDLTSSDTVDYLYDLSLRIGKEPIRVNKDVPGFIGNRIQLAILREALHLVENEVGTFEDIDRCMKYALGFRYSCLGPFEVCDMGGLDTFHHIAEYLYPDLSDAKEPHKILKELFNEGSYGVKAQKGFYDYSQGKDEEAIRKRDDLYIKVSKLLHS